jgi:hypothetical protein
MGTSETYTLLTFLLIDGQVFVVDKMFSEDKETLEFEARHRKVNNSDYRFVLMTYSLKDATIL